MTFHPKCQWNHCFLTARNGVSNITLHAKFAFYKGPTPITAERWQFCVFDNSGFAIKNSMVCVNLFNIRLFFIFVSQMKISRPKMPKMPKIRGFSGNKRDFIHAFWVAFTFLRMSVNDKTEHLKCNYIIHNGKRNLEYLILSCIETSNQ